MEWNGMEWMAIIGTQGLQFQKPTEVRQVEKILSIALHKYILHKSQSSGK